MRVGILHSLTGGMAANEAPLKDAELLAIAEINKAGDILGESIEPIIEDGASNPAEFKHKARKLLQQDQVATVFGCWTSDSRKAVLPVFEELNALLWYPVRYEGLECSSNVFIPDHAQINRLNQRSRGCYKTSIGGFFCWVPTMPLPAQLIRSSKPSLSRKVWLPSAKNIYIVR